MHRHDLRGYEWYRYPTFWTGVRVPYPYFQDAVKNLLSSEAQRGDLRRLNCTKTVFGRGSTNPIREAHRDGSRGIVGFGRTPSGCTFTGSACYIKNSISGRFGYQLNNTQLLYILYVCGATCCAQQATCCLLPATCCAGVNAALAA